MEQAKTGQDEHDRSSSTLRRFRQIGCLYTGSLPPSCDMPRSSWTVAHATAIGLLSVIPSKNRPRSQLINELAAAVLRNLPECRRLWWIYQQNNPLVQTRGACCLNNSLYRSWIVKDAAYDPGTHQTTLRFTNGQTLPLQM